MIKAVYSGVPAPGISGAMIEVYGDPSGAWYEWRIVAADGRVVHDTVNDGHESFQGRQYFSPEIALRDALIHASRD